QQQARLGTAAERLGELVPERGRRRPAVGDPGGRERLLVARRERPDRVGVQAALLAEPPAGVPDLVLCGEPLSDLHVLVCERLLGPVELFQRRPDLAHRVRSCEAIAGTRAAPSPPATFTTRTAAVLKTGCFDTGSHRVVVSSLAARARPFGSPPSGSSQ